MKDRSRRRFLGLVAGGGVAALAGCVDDVPGTGSSGELPSYSRWLPADFVDDHEHLLVVHADVRRVQDDWSEASAMDGELDALETQFGVDREDVEELVTIVRTDETASHTDTILLGSFDVEALVEAFTQGVVETEEYEGYETVEVEEAGAAFALGSDAIVVSPAFRTLIDASVGETERVAEGHEHWDAVLRDVGGAGISFLQAGTDDEYELLGAAWTADGDEFDATTYAHFEDESAAEDGLAEVEARLDDRHDDGEVTDVRVEGNVVVVEARVEEFDW